MHKIIYRVSRLKEVVKRYNINKITAYRVQNIDDLKKKEPKKRNFFFHNVSPFEPFEVRHKNQSRRKKKKTKKIFGRSPLGETPCINNNKIDEILEKRTSINYQYANWTNRIGLINYYY